jgi:hypothetical protein
VKWNDENGFICGVDLDLGWVYRAFQGSRFTVHFFLSFESVESSGCYDSLLTVYSLSLAMVLGASGLLFDGNIFELRLRNSISVASK